MSVRDFFVKPPQDRYGESSIKIMRVVSLLIVFIIIVFLATSSYQIIPPNQVGVKIRLGVMDPHPYSPGWHWRTPFIEQFETLSISVQAIEVTESTASQDIQEVTTTLSVQYTVNPSMAPQVYVKYGTNPKMWETTQIVPVLLEELKATTADWTAEQLIQERPNVMMELYEFLENRLEPLGFTVVTVNIEDMQFSKEFTQAIEDKVVATQESLAEKNRVEIVRYQQMQQILQKQGEANRTVIEARALAEKTKIAADAEAYKIFAEYKATADGIQAIRDSLTSDYLTYEMLNQWDGKLPVIIGDDGSLFLDVRALIQEPN